MSKQKARTELEEILAELHYKETSYKSEHDIESTLAQIKELMPSVEDITDKIQDTCKFESTGNLQKDCEKWETEPFIGIEELSQAIHKLIEGRLK